MMQYSFVATMVGTAFGVGVAVGKVERLNQKLEGEEYKAHKNDRR